MYKDFAPIAGGALFQNLRAPPRRRRSALSLKLYSEEPPR